MVANPPPPFPLRKTSEMNKIDINKASVCTIDEYLVFIVRISEINYLCELKI